MCVRVFIASVTDFMNILASSDDGLELGCQGFGSSNKYRLSFVYPGFVECSENIKFIFILSNLRAR